MLSPRLGRLLPALAAAMAVALAGCGDDEAASPLDEALGYLPEDAGFVIVASTDLDDYGGVARILDRFPFGGRVEDALRQGLEQEDIDFEQEVEPLLGNELVIGTADNASFLDRAQETPFIVAVETRDAETLEGLARDNAEERGEREGYDVYQADDTWAAIEDDVLVLSDSEETLERALDQRGEDDRLREDDLETTFEELPDDSPVRVYANVSALLAAAPGAEEALKVKWVDHIETFGMAADASEDAVTLEWSVRTDADGLSDEDLPLASGDEAPQLLEREAGSAEIVIGLRDPSQVVDFTLAAARVLDPAGFAEFQAGKQGVGRQLGIDVDEDVLAQLTGNLTAAATVDGTFGLRASLEDPDEFERTLAKIMDGLPDFSDDLTVTEPRGDERFYGLATADGKSYAVGVAGDALVVANDAELASEVATRDLVDAEAGEGALVVTADAEQLVNAALAEFAGGLEGIGGSLFTGPLGDLVSSAAASTEGVTGRLELEIE